MEYVSVVVPCKNEEVQIANCIESLLSNGYPKEYLEILIVDGLSSDRTVEIVKEMELRYSSVKLLSNPKEKTPFALNIGIDNARGDYILIASGHSSFEKGYISTLLQEMKKLHADIVGGVMKTKLRVENNTSVAIAKVLSHPFGVGNSTFRTGIDKSQRVDTVPFGLYTASILKSINGYDERLIRNHDIEMSKRLLAKGAKIFLVPNAVCYYYARASWSALAKNNFDNGKWNLLTVYITKDFSSLSLRHFVPLCFMLSLVLPLFASLLYGKLYILSVLSILFYVLSVSIIGVKMERSGTTLLHLIISFFVLHFSYGVGSFVGMFNLKTLFK